MTTSMNTPSNPLGAGGLNEAAGNLPDVAELTRLANEFYSAPPGYSTPPGPRVSGKQPAEVAAPPPGMGTFAAWPASPSPTVGTPYNVPHSATGTHVAPSFLDNRPAGIPSEVPGPDAVASYPGAGAVHSIAPEGPYHVPPSASVTPFSRTPAPTPVAPKGPYGVPPSAAAAPVPGTHAASAIAPEGPYQVPPSASATPFSRTPAPSPVAPRGPYGVPPSAAAAPVPRTHAASSIAPERPYHVPPSASASPFSRTRAPTPVAPRGPYNVPPSAAAGPGPGFAPFDPTGGASHYAIPYAGAAAQAANLPEPPAFGADVPFADAGRFTAFPGVPSVLPSYDIPGIHTRTSAGSGALPVPGAGEPSFYFLDGANPFGSGGRTSGLAGMQGLGAHPAFDAYMVRRDFPILGELVNGRPLIWLDNAATTQKPQAVIDRLTYFYQHENSNIHRAAHELAARATDAYEGARETVRRFLNASSSDEIVFLRGTTEAINLVAHSWGRQNVREGDEIVITWLEHHANIVPWQQLANAVGAKLRVAPVDDDGQILLDEYQKLLGSRTKVVSLSQVSNALGTVTPAREMIEMAHRVGARVLVDGAQSVSHMRVDMQQLDCDWFVFSGHKVFGPTGIGALYGKKDLLDSTPPWQGGGNMIQNVTFEKTEYHEAPARFEAGTGNIADAVGLGAALEYVERIGIDNINRYEHELMAYATRGLSTVSGLRLIGTAAEKAGVLSFSLKGFTTEEVGSALNEAGIAVRAGHHCAQPILRRYGLETTVRPSLAMYNTYADVDALVAALHRMRGGRNVF